MLRSSVFRMICGPRLLIVPQGGGLEIDRPGCGAGYYKQVALQNDGLGCDG
jgi:hypothetical protein